LAWPAAAFARTDPPSPLPSALTAVQASAPHELRSPDTRDAARVDDGSRPQDWRTLDTRSAPRPAFPHSADSRTPGSSTRPATIPAQPVRPERTILRDKDEVLPAFLSSAALVVVVCGSAFLIAGSIRRRASSNRA
jgi:hypothetical protein